ncbi:MULTISPECIES: S66 family peptidase [Thermoanaerobacterium]|uniref:Peptidase U61 LD-carboxypeptidase A n=2 Tax=Thermoanaerobacterium TaxID=28895 RepID=W9EH41_9THEO|nr:MULTISPECIES: S66 peptidase family protein [Thermoanaerobacterium]AFK86102.1 peptidase U61 LD-carboxypeptidase A [Thermoanaerobacterium saccharolyticum JW/SL-YS485]ETO39034.1 peptidase U61 LD-carboxypeptidase A [Thermoanaerobacterium aotearoense SCUT27]
MIKPKRLKQSSKIAIISPSNGLPFLFPDIYELGLKNLREIIGLDIVEMPTARMSPDELYKNPKLRADDINNAFADDSIDGIITSIGGYESVRILQYLNTDMTIKNPKFIMGFSDATTFLTYLNYMGMVTFYGPSVMAGFAQLKSLPLQFTEHIKTVLFSNDYPYSYAPYTEWTNGYKDWSNRDTLGECTEFYSNEKGWVFLQGNKTVEGRLWGGCIEVLEFMKSTAYWPDKDFWNDRILFFETSEEKPLPNQVDYMLRNYGIQGVLNKVKGIIFGRPKDYSNKEKEELNSIILRIVKDEFNASEIPIVVDMDFGHTDPKVILPLGCMMRLNPEANECTLLESPFM